MKLEVDSFKTGDLDVMQLHLSGKTKQRWGCGFVCGRIICNTFILLYTFKHLITFSHLSDNLDRFGGDLGCFVVALIVVLRMKLLSNELGKWPPRCFAGPHISQFGFRICNKAWMGMLNICVLCHRNVWTSPVRYLSDLTGSTQLSWPLIVNDINGWKMIFPWHFLLGWSIFRRGLLVSG